jgi:hypothetical protein
MEFKSNSRKIPLNEKGAIKNVMVPLLFLILITFVPQMIRAQDGVQPGEFIVEPPTLTNLGFEWKISGDADRNATVSVEYRAAGTQEWKKALPLLRIGDEHVGRAKENLDYTVPPMFAGSILDVAPGTEYECRFTMEDIDNKVKEVKVVRVRTRTEPKAYQGGRVLHVYPANWTGEKKEPSFTTLQGAYYGSGTGDWNVVQERTINPGDIIEVHAGLYEADRTNYVNPEGVPFDGTYFLTVKATEEKPIVIRSAGDGEVIFDGAGAHTFFDVSASENHIFEGLTFRNADIVFYAGYKHITGAKNLTIRNCRMENVGEGIITEFEGSKNFYIADNVLIGRDDRYRILGWANPRNIYGVNKMYSYIGIKVCGSGHVICHNAVAFFHDAIDVSTYGTPETEQELKSVSVDIYNNDIHLMADDFIEADGGVHNIRVMRNRSVNSGQCGLSAQPIFGGPAYFIRNIVYNVPTGNVLKVDAKPAGLYVFHNTFISENTYPGIYSNAHFRNNLFLGTDVARRPVAVFPLATSYSTYDYDGYRLNAKNESNFRWVAPPAGQLQNYSISLGNGKSFNSLKNLSAESGLEVHGIEIDYDIFENLQAPKPNLVYHATDLNFKLKPNSKVVDIGIRLPGVNDNFTGKAPDLGALEAGAPEPVYGPRGEILNRPFYR